VPQGSVISPHLFNFFCHDCPNHSQQNSNYADDFELSESSPDIGTLTENLKHISKWTKDNKLAISTSKSCVPLFSPHTSQSNVCPDVSIDGVPVPLDKGPKWLGVTLNKLGIYSPQAESAEAKGRKGHRLLKAVSGQDFGDKEVLLMTYNTHIKPSMTHGAPVWFPSMDPESTAIKRMQRVQNDAMRTITGNHKMAPINHLLAECKLLPIKEHLGLLCK
jgi:hypothetical protein